jgi:squalene-hopene/tetraprenyl-beta-curcumene cyclase
VGRHFHVGRCSLRTLLLACGATAAVGAEPAAWQEAIDRGTAFLVARQSADGGWRSDVYGNFRAGDGLTPLVLAALEPEDAAFASGRRFLAGLAGDGAGDPALEYPVYTAALAVRTLARDPADREAAARWITVLRRHQLVARLGWRPADTEYGGWGYATVEPRKPGPGDVRLPLLEPNLSATVFAVEALRAAGAEPADPAIGAALVFVERCQNFAAAESAADPAHDDGGFFFVLQDAGRTKAGAGGRDRHGRERFTSYGSATADGLRALLACGLPVDHPRVVAARDWLARHFSAEVHAGRFPEDRHVFRDACFFYYAWSVAAALEAVGVERVRAAAGPVAWRQPLAAALVARQGGDGSWTNAHRAVREDDPLVATAFAVAALRICCRQPPP